jgi:hypothetical protein
MKWWYFVLAAGLGAGGADAAELALSPPLPE